MRGFWVLNGMLCAATLISGIPCAGGVQEMRNSKAIYYRDANYQEGCEEEEFIENHEEIDEDSEEIDISQYVAMASVSDNIIIAEPDDITGEMLENRNGKIIIQVQWGIAVDDEGNGRVLNTATTYNYTSYRCVPGIQKGDIVLTYLVFNPENDYIDDIVARSDFIMSR